MAKYKVLQYFEWGRLVLDKGQIILAEDRGDGNSVISVEHYPEKSQPVATQAIENMIRLKKIEKY